MTHGLLLLAAASLALATATASSTSDAAPASMRRIAVLVGANAPPPGSPPLRYARDDASELAAVLQQVGGFAPGDVHVLLDPHPAELLSALDDARQVMGHTAGDALFVFYYSGHSDGHALYPHGEPVDLTALRDRIERLGARIRVGILDTCRGGSWTQSKGLSVGPPLTSADLMNIDTEGTALVSSSSGVEDAHEADALKGSFFTHYLAAGLRGAADLEGDGDVTLQEVFDYARQRTIRDSARLGTAPQHPSFDLTLRGRQDIVLAMSPASASGLQISVARAPVEIIHLPSGVSVADIPPGPRAPRIALPPGRYLVRKTVDGNVYTKEVDIHPGETVTLADGELEAVASEQLVVKGSGDRVGSPSAIDLRPTAFVHVAASRAVVLESSDRNGPWTVACTAPCDRDLPLTSAYRLGGTGVRSSASFQLAARAGEHLSVRASTASRAAFVGGVVLTVAGAVSMLGSVLVGVTESAAQSSGQATDGMKAAAIGMFGGGAVAIAGGVLLMVENLHSSAEQSSAPAPQSPPRADAWLRSPTWHEDRTAGSPRAAAVSVPLVQLGF